MNYGYDTNDALIKNIKPKDNVMVITYLDGTTNEVPLTEHMVNQLKNIMIKQAINRNKSSALEEAKNNLRLNYVRMIIKHIEIAFSTFFGISSKELAFKFAFFSISAMACLELSTIYGKIVFKKEEINELLKYDIFLKIKDDLNDPNVYNGVDKAPLDIDTLDEYSLQEIKTIESNIHNLKRLDVIKLSLKK